MKVMWFINNEIPIIKTSNLKENFVNEGWITGMLTAIDKYLGDDIKIIIVYPQKYKREDLYNEINGIQTIGYYRNWNAIKYNCKLSEKFISIINNINPDVIHVMGSEFPHTYSVCCACEQLKILDKLVISIQGLISVCATQYTIGLPYNIIHSYTIRDMIKGNIYKEQKNFYNRGKYEILAIKKAKNVIGRTEWDFACTNQINNNVNYYFNNEVLRKSFYEKRWSYEKCDKHTIFISQGGYPIKGLHFLLDALKIVKNYYPNVKLRIAGHNILAKSKFKRSSYSNYIASLIKNNNLQGQVVFTGLLSEKDIIKEYIKANIFISPSVIENSPNSVGEAMLLGMPVISSDVGGVKNFISHGKNGYIYPCNEPYMLAHYIVKYFDDYENAIKMGENAHNTAKRIFNRKENALQLKKIYQEIISNSK